MPDENVPPMIDVAEVQVIPSVVKVVAEESPMLTEVTGWAGTETGVLGVYAWFLETSLDQVELVDRDLSVQVIPSVEVAPFEVLVETATNWLS